MLKTTSLAAAITVGELTNGAKIIYSRTYEVIPLLMVASFWYLIVSSVLTVGQYYVERHFARGAVRELPPTPIQKLRRKMARIAAWAMPSLDGGSHDPIVHGADGAGSQRAQVVRARSKRSAASTWRWGRVR